MSKPQSTPLNRDEVRDKLLDMIREERSIMEIMNLVDLYTQKHSNTALQAFAKEVEDEVIGDGKNDSVHNYNAHETKEIFRIEQHKSLDNLIDKWAGVEDE